ncbi:hypothetical protein GCM10027347_22230 [Larkinella harenae]
MYTHFSFRQIAAVASLVVASLVNLPMLTLANRPLWPPVPGLPDVFYQLTRLLFHLVFTYFFIELNCYGLSEKKYRTWSNLSGWYGFNFVLFVVITGVFVAMLLPWYPQRPVLVMVATYFRTFFVWGTALLIANFLTVVQQNRRFQSENERLKQEKLQAQLDGLRAQLNPHFLFNSLNALSSLIREGSSNTQPYLSRLSQVLRYSLQVQHRPLVSFAEEMQFTTAYLFLLAIRFGDNLRIENALPTQAAWLLPPMSMQLLIENAVKHNVISRAKPLTIHLLPGPAGSYIEIRNNYQPKAEFVDGTGLGLSNLESRFQLLGGKSIQIFRSEHEFCVRLPIIPATHARTDH